MTDFQQLSSSILKLRKEYSKASLQRRDLDPYPITQFAFWLNQALEIQALEPHACTLCTSDRSGSPNGRMVLIRELDERGFVFFTNYKSRKSDELNENPLATMIFFWPELERQVRILGVVSKIEAAQSDHYFASRPREAQLSAWASPQSQVVAQRETLRDKFYSLEKHYQGQQIPRPSFWGGFRLTPRLIEFWQGRPNRLHDRFLYTLQMDGAWEIERLAP